ncbi:MAG: hypothetical protein AB7I27_11205 [Bacteriovoracaceae bacterium]
MNRLKKISLPTIALLSLAISCSPNKNDNKKFKELQKEVTINPNGLSADSMFMASFTTLNPHIVGTIPGSATVKRNDNKLYVYSRIFAGAPKAWHQQNIHSGTRCPTPQDDANGDGYIDIEEAFNVVGKILIPLDADISSQKSGKNFFPLGDLSGSYSYERVTSFNSVLNDLRSTDPDANDDFAKISPDENLIIEGKVVMIQGVNDDVEFPETVATHQKHQTFQTLPIACGIFKEVTEIPGETYDNEIPGPVAEVSDGQDHPAPDDSSPNTTGIPTPATTGSNETHHGETPTTDENGHESSTPATTGATPHSPNDSTPSNPRRDDAGTINHPPTPTGDTPDPTTESTPAPTPAPNPNPESTTGH